MNGELVWLDRAKQAIERVATIGEAKDISDKAAAIKLLAAKQGWSKDQKIRIAEIEVRAQRRLGELLAETPKATGTRGQGRPPLGGATREPPIQLAPTLADMGISKKQSHVAQAVASVPVADFEGAIAAARDNDKVPTATAIQRAAKEAERQARRDENAKKAEAMVEAPTAAPAIIIPDVRFATIVADPPWDWGDEGDVDQMGRAKPDYATMPFDQLRALAPWGRKMGDVADTDCHLYLWITNRSMPKGATLLESWGFRFITILTWPKPSFGMGNYFRGQTEHVLFGVRGSQALRRKDASTLLPTWRRGPGGHSSKPPEFLEFVESCSPGPYLELFARSARPGWTPWGADA